MLAPEIQERLLFLPEVATGRPAIQERMLRPIAAEVDWGRQRGMLDGTKAEAGNRRQTESNHRRWFDE